MLKMWTDQVSRPDFKKSQVGPGKYTRPLFNTAGFTLIELLVAVLISGIVVLTLGSMLVTDQKYWDQGTKKLRLIEDASLVMSKMASELRAGSNTDSLKEVTAYTDSIHIGPKCFKRDGTGNFLFYDGSVTHTLISGKVDSLRFTYPIIHSSSDTLEKAVGIDLNLSNGNLQVSMRSTVTLRN